MLIFQISQTEPVQQSFVTLYKYWNWLIYLWVLLYKISHLSISGMEYHHDTGPSLSQHLFVHLLDLSPKLWSFWKHFTSCLKRWEIFLVVFWLCSVEFWILFIIISTLLKATTDLGQEATRIWQGSLFLRSGI